MSEWWTPIKVGVPCFLARDVSIYVCYYALIIYYINLPSPQTNKSVSDVLELLPNAKNGDEIFPALQTACASKQAKLMILAIGKEIEDEMAKKKINQKSQT